MNEQQYEKLLGILGEKNLLKDEVMLPHTSMKVGGPADYYITPETKEALKKTVQVLSESETAFYVLGNCSNVIVKDAGYRGALIQLQKMNGICVNGTEITADAGASLKDVSEAACEAGLTGFEFACGIPGSMGGATVMNSGAYEGEMSNVIKCVTAIDRKGNEKLFGEGGEPMKFSYRHSGFSDGEYIITSVTIALEAGDKSAIREKIDDFDRQRAEKQPLEYPSCGSVFKRPEGYFVGQLVQEAGMAGQRVGGASVSRKHCGFVINDKEGTASNVLGLIGLIQRNIKNKFGVELECEVRVLE